MSYETPIFSGVAAYGSLQSTAAFGTESVPSVQISTGAYAVGAFNTGLIVLTDDYTPSFGPIIPTFGGFYNSESNGLVINRIWAPTQPLTAQILTAAAAATTYSLSLTSVVASTGNTYNGYTIYTGTITGGASNAFAGYTFTISGFANGTNNGTFLVIASTATTLTVYNSAAVAESAAATASSGTTVYTGTIQGTGYAGGYVTIAGFTNAANNGSFLVVASSSTTLTLLNSAGVVESHAATATLNGNMSFSGETINVIIAPSGNPNLDDSAYISGLSVNMTTNTQTTISGSSSGAGITAIVTENSVGLPSGNTSTVQIHQVIGLYTESLIGNFANPDGVYNIDDHWNYHCAGMGYVGHATGTIGSSAGIFMEGPRVPAGCTLTARYGILMQPQNQNSGGTNTNAWGIYQASSTEKNQLGIIIAGTSVTTPSLILTGTVTDGSSSVGTSGQVLSSTVTGTKWSSLSNSSSIQTVRSGPHSITAATLGGPYTINFTTPFADGNYTVQVTAVIGETSSYGAVTSIIAIASVQQQGTPGTGVIVSVSNADSITHTVTIQVTAIHD